jgi:hypothetical protein
VVATPDGGIQPQAVADEAGVVHVIYFKGEPGHGDLFYARSKPGTTEFSMSLRMRLLGQRPRYQEGPPEGAGSVR